jgi:hypothetical protein
MKSNIQTTSNAKAQISKIAKPAKRKASTAVKGISRSVKNPNGKTQSMLAGYSDSAQRLISRSKAAFGDASEWAGKTLPRAARNLGVPDQRSVQTFMAEKPLIVGAVGIGIGVVLGAMLPAVGSKAAPKRRK